MDVLYQWMYYQAWCSTTGKKRIQTKTQRTGKAKRDTDSDRPTREQLLLIQRTRAVILIQPSLASEGWAAGSDEFPLLLLLFAADEVAVKCFRLTCCQRFLGDTSSHKAGVIVKSGAVSMPYPCFTRSNAHFAH